MTKPDATGRASNDVHIRLYNWLTSSPAWRSLSGNAVKLLIYIASFDNGKNNGELYMSERHAAEGIQVSKKTAHKLFVELQEKGFIVLTAPGSFKAKRSPAAQWRLTFKPWPAQSRGPTNEWRNWRITEERRGKFLPVTGVISSRCDEEDGATGVIITPDTDAKSQKTDKPELAKTTPQIIAITRALVGDDPVTIMRTSIADWWRKSGKSDRLRVAKKNGLEIGELLGFVDGSHQLQFPKVVALHSNLKATVIPFEKTGKCEWQ